MTFSSLSAFLGCSILYRFEKATFYEQNCCGSFLNVSDFPFENLEKHLQPSHAHLPLGIYNTKEFPVVHRKAIRNHPFFLV